MPTGQTLPNTPRKPMDPLEKRYYYEMMREYAVHDDQRPPFTHISRITGIPYTTLNDLWTKTDPDTLPELPPETATELRSRCWTTTKRKVSDRVQIGAMVAADTIIDLAGDRDNSRSFRDHSIGLATMIDKASHLEGDPIGRYAHKHDHSHSHTHRVEHIFRMPAKNLEAVLARSQHVQMAEGDPPQRLPQPSLEVTGREPLEVREIGVVGDAPMPQEATTDGKP